jgi:membrane-associated protein
MKKVAKILLILLVITLAAFLLTRQIDLNKVLATYGLIALALILFAETGLLIGFFLPGDTLLFAAGFFAAQGKINLVVALIVLFIATFLGNIVGYELGKRSGPKIFKSNDALLFSRQNVEYAEVFYKKHGGKTILIARFIPVIRTLAPLIAGIGKMRYRLFIIYNFIGGAFWVSAVTLIGFWAGKVLGRYFNIDKYILPAVLLATTATLGVSFWRIWKDPTSRQHLKKSIRKYFKR